jgi:alkylated DNA repair dioxygenase AlkB
MMQHDDLFADDRRDYRFGPDAMLLAGYALPQETQLLDDLMRMLAAAPLRIWETPVAVLCPPPNGTVALTAGTPIVPATAT